MIDILIPSYKRARNLKTVKYFEKIGYEMGRLHVLIDSEAGDEQEYGEEAKKKGFKLAVFDQEEARDRYDYVHRPSESRRSVGQARNMFYDYADGQGMDFFIVQDDDTTGYEVKQLGRYFRMATLVDILQVFEAVREFMERQRIGMFGIPQTEDFIGGTNDRLLINKVMNTTFYLRKYIYRAEKGILDPDTSQFVGIMNEGLFTGSTGDGLCLKQTTSAKAKGGLTELYNEAKLLTKSLVCPIQFPSAIHAEKQEKNGGRLHHSIKSRYLYPKLIRVKSGGNIAWDRYPEDYPFTNEPVRKTNKREGYEIQGRSRENV